MFDRLKARWGLQSNYQVVAVFLVFSLAGSMILPVRKFLFHLLQYNEQTPFWLKTITWLIIVFPTYQFFLLVFGSLLGQFRFFWEKEKKMAHWLLRRLHLGREPEATT